MPDGTDRINHVIVLMLENRSFDHMLGWPAVAGRQIPVEPANPAAGLAPVVVWNTPDAYRTTPDPGHEFEDVTVQLFGGAEPPATATPTNDGFVLSYSQRRDDEGHQVGPEVGKKIHPRTQHRAAMFVADQMAKLTGATPARAKGPADRGPQPSGKRSRKGRGATSRRRRA